MKKNKGVSMIVLIITIIVVLILATTAILTLKDENSINKAKEVVLRDDILTFKNDLEAYIDNKRFESISMGQFYSPENDSNLDEVTEYQSVKEIIPSMLQEYKDIFGIINGKFAYVGTEQLDEKTAQIMDETGVYYVAP